MKFIEKPLLNTHYYLRPDYKLRSYHTHHYTVTPEIINKIFFKNDNIIYLLPNENWLIQLDHSQEAPIGQFKKITSYALVPDKDILAVHTTDWFKRCWDKVLLVSNPIYEYENKHYIFSNRFARAVEIDLTTSVIEQIFEIGAFSIINGINVALGLVALHKLKEKDFIHDIDQLNDGNHVYNTFPLYHTFPNAWTSYIITNPVHPADHLCKFAFTFNTERIYKHMFYITREDMFIYHIPQRHVSTITSYASTRNQFVFASYFKGKYEETDMINIKPNLYHLLQMKDFASLCYIIKISKVSFVNVLGVMSDIYKKHKCLHRHLKNLWRYFIKEFKEDWVDNIYEFFIDKIIAYDNGKNYPCLPRKLIRDTIHTEKFKYDNFWKILFKYVDFIFGTKYTRFFDRRKIMRIKILKSMTDTHPEGHIVEFIMKDFYERNPYSLVH